MFFLTIPSPIVLAGKDSSLRLCDTVASSGCKNVLLVTDTVLVELGLHARIVESLNDKNVNVVVFDGVKPDPTIEQIKQGLALLKEHQCDAVLALGGGSSLDAGKIISVAATTKKTIEKMVGLLKVDQIGLPFYAVPTTAGTGSEATIVAVISDLETSQKKQYIDTKLVPRMAALDPVLMQGMPKGITSATGMDALTHAVEAYLSLNATEHTDSLAVSAVRLVFKSLETSYADGTDLNARLDMALASFYAGSAFTVTSVGYVHAVAHTFGARYHTPHGLANAIAMPWVLDFYQEHDSQSLAELARVAGLDNGSMSDEQLSLSFIAAIRAFNKTMKIPSYLDALNESDIEGMAKTILAEAHGNYAIPHYMNQAQCESLLKLMWLRK